MSKRVTAFQGNQLVTNKERTSFGKLRKWYDIMMKDETWNEKNDRPSFHNPFRRGAIYTACYEDSFVSKACSWFRWKVICLLFTDWNKNESRCVPTYIVVVIAQVFHTVVLKMCSTLGEETSNTPVYVVGFAEKLFVYCLQTETKMKVVAYQHT